MRTNENNTGDGRGERTNTNWGLLNIVISFFSSSLHHYLPQDTVI